MFSRIRIPLALLTSLAVLGATAAVTVAGRRSPTGSALIGAAPVGTGPSAVAVDPATHTIYVANGYNDNGSQLPVPGNTVSVIDTRHCQARDISSCKGPWPTITVGKMPSGIAIDQQTDTVYVSNVGDNTVSVFNGATCSAKDSSGCGQKPATVPVGLDPLGLFLDPANHTVYVSDYGAPAVTGPPDSTTVSMLDSATCNASDLRTCPTTPPPTVDVGATSPDDVTVDQANHTVYVATVPTGKPGSNSGWTVFDANTCNATVQSGCGQLGILPGDPSGPNDAQVDPANDTLYSANYDNTVSAFDLRGCNAEDLAGCATDRPGIVTPFPDPGFGENDLWLAVDVRLHSVYVVYQRDDALLVIDANRCKAATLKACATLRPAEIHTGADPEEVALDPQTQTLYTANQDSNNVSVIDPARCDAQTTSRCRAQVPRVAIAPGSLAADPAVGTTYVADGAHSVSMIDTRRCNARRPEGCHARPPTVNVGASPTAIAVDPATHTVYVTDAGHKSSKGTITVFDDHSCNATSRKGCSTISTMPDRDGTPVGIAVNPRTDTLYVATLTHSGRANLISVYNGSTCNATTTTGCHKTPSHVATGSDGGKVGSTEALAVDPATNTVYATSDTLGDPFVGRTVYMIDGATCDAANTKGCDKAPARISLASNRRFGQPNPFGIAVDQATDTVYTANIFNGEGAGTISVINGAGCNAHDRSGCHRTPAVAPAGFGANAIAVDPTTNRIYAANIEDTSVTTLNGNTCNGADTRRCGHTQTEAIVGEYPNAIVVDPAVDTAYVADSEGISVMALTP